MAVEVIKCGLCQQMAAIDARELDVEARDAAIDALFNQAERASRAHRAYRQRRRR